MKNSIELEQKFDRLPISRKIIIFAMIMAETTPALKITGKVLHAIILVIPLFLATMHQEFALTIYVCLVVFIGFLFHVASKFDALTDKL